ncbi:MAG: hypothetical protein JNM70_23600 [Anaerolineae bacterium]|nr:hypothetical protein [Anaerolineae bacterium]
MSAIAAIAATKPGIFPVEIGLTLEDMSQNRALAPAQIPPSGTKLPIAAAAIAAICANLSGRRGRHFGQFSLLRRSATLSLTTFPTKSARILRIRILSRFSFLSLFSSCLFENL